VTPSSLELVYSFRPRPEVVRAAVQQGAAGYACKNWSSRQLVSALEQVVAGRHLGGHVVTPARIAAGPDDVAEAGLSPREVQLLRLVAQGLSNADIATEMTVSVNSVKSYIRSAYRKIGVTRRTQAVLWTLSHDLDRAPRRVPSP
jgi:NarL family two-component system response regulator LiaR